MPTPAAEILSKSILPTWMDSTEIRASIAAEIRQRSLFSAKMTSMGYLKTLQRVCAAYADGTINAADARLRLLQTLEGLGFDVSGQGGLRDPSSPRRLNLIIETQRKMAASVARLQAQTPDAREAYPAWRLERYGSRREPREDWPVRWYQAGQAVGWVGAHRSQMVALKSSPIWQALGEGAGGFRDTLGNPYPPFAYGSGLEWTDVSAEESERLGLGRYQLTEAERVSLAPSDAELRDAMAKTGLTPEDFLIVANSADAREYVRDDHGRFAEVPGKKVKGQNTWETLGYKAGKEFHCDPAVERVAPEEAKRLIGTKKESVTDPLGRTIRIDEDTLKHIEDHEEEDADERLKDYARAKEAIRNPHEIWRDLMRHGGKPRWKYAHYFDDGGQRNVIFVVVEVKEDPARGKKTYVLSWHKSHKSFDHWRYGRRIYVRKGEK